MTPDERAARIARGQFGLLTSRDASAAGLSRTQILARIESRGWVRRSRGLYLLPGAPLRSWRQDAMAAVLLAGKGARASHLTSAALHELWRPPLLPHVTVRPTGSARTRLAGVHRSQIPTIDRTTVDGVPCTSASRAVVEGASILDRSSLEELVDQALTTGRASPESVAGALERAGIHWLGRTLLESVLQIWTEDIDPDSPAEVRLVRRLVEWGAREVVIQHEVRDEHGAFVARLDVAVPELLLGFEYDSDRFHNPRRYGRDEPRHAALVRLGWQIEHASKRDLLPSARRIADILAARLAR